MEIFQIKLMKGISKAIKHPNFIDINKKAGWL